MQPLAGLKVIDFSTPLPGPLEAVRDPHFVGRGLFAGALSDGAGRSMPTLPVPLAPVLHELGDQTYPRLGEADRLLE